MVSEGVDAQRVDALVFVWPLARARARSPCSWIFCRPAGRARAAEQVDRTGLMLNRGQILCSAMRRFLDRLVPGIYLQRGKLTSSKSMMP